jgi:glutamine cyclotransferase
MIASRPLALASLLIVGACTLAGSGGGRAAASTVLELETRVVAEYPHDAGAFTQGLIWHDGRLYESTGEYGSSTLRRVELESGEAEKSVDLPDELFGEGLERIGDRLIQLTWRERVARVYDLETFEVEEELAYLGEGWGLCFDSVELVRSDGTQTLHFHDPASFAPLRQVTVTLAGRPVPFLNELECAEGSIYANVFQTDAIVRIDPTTGQVTARIDASSLLPDRRGSGAGVLNGIAYRPDTATFLLTGKNWPTMFEVVFVERQR